MTVYAKVIEDSVSQDGVRLTTLEVNFWRPMLAEFNTHRVFSRNSASSRAIPLRKKNKTGTLDRIESDPAWPLEWPCEQSGMSGGDALEGIDLDLAQQLFREVHQSTIRLYESYKECLTNNYPEADEKELATHMLHKSLLNRLFEPFMWHRVIVTATDWEGWVAQRCHPDAQPEIRVPAEAIRDALAASVPKLLRKGEYHLPYITEEERAVLPLFKLIRISIARCARVSYLTHDGVRDLDKDVDLFNKLDSQNPPHYSPMEHVATPARVKKWYTPWRKRPLGNFYYWKQIRHYRPKEF